MNVKDMRIILASASPRRREILEEHGVECVIIPADVDETLPPYIPDTDAKRAVSYLAELKARSVELALLAGEALIPEGCTYAELPELILAADTIVFDGHIIGKPTDEADGFAILSRLRDMTHEVWSGVSIIDRRSGGADTFAVVTYVMFKDYPDEEIYRFLREEKPYDKSGSYAIQSSWSANVASVDGSILNVIGLPWEAVSEHINKLPLA